MRPPHEVLGVSANAGRAEIDGAYRRRLLYLNPHAFEAGTAERADALRELEEVKDAYAILAARSTPGGLAVPPDPPRYSRPPLHRVMLLLLLPLLLLFVSSMLLLRLPTLTGRRPDAGVAAVPNARQAPMAPDERSPIERVAQKTMRATVLIEVENRDGETSIGSGFFVNDRGDILTNHHVIEDAVKIVIVTNSERSYQAQVRASDERGDMALLSSEVPASESEPLAISTATPGIGSGVVVVGSPFRQFQSVSDGIVAGIRERDGITAVQITAPISPGSSGGPVVNLNNEVIGMSTAILIDAQNMNFAVSSKHLASFISRAEKMPPQPLGSRSVPSRERVLTPGAPERSGPRSRVALPTQRGFMGCEWGSSVAALRSKLPDLRYLRAQRFGHINLDFYTTARTFSAFDTSMEMIVFCGFSAGRLVTVRFVAASRGQEARRSGLTIMTELTRRFGTKGERMSGGERWHTWYRGDVAVIAIDPYSQENRFFIDFTYIPILAEYLGGDGEDFSW